MRTQANFTTLTLAAALTGALALGCGSAEEDPRSPDEVVAEEMPNDTWVSLSGTVSTTAPDSFVLDYGEGEILVEMDDYDFYDESNALLEDDEVIVYGYIDDDFYEARSIEASSVYVPDLGTQFYASGADEEDFPVVAVIPERPRIELSGTVTNVSGRELDLDTGAGVLDVDTSQMLYDPLDDEGFQQIDVGDRIRVTGHLSYGLFLDQDLMADVITSLESGEGSA